MLHSTPTRHSKAFAAANPNCRRPSLLPSSLPSHYLCFKRLYLTIAAARHSVRCRFDQLLRCRLRLVLVHLLVGRGVGVVGAPSQSPAWQPSGAQLAKSREHEAENCAHPSCV